MREIGDTSVRKDLTIQDKTNTNIQRMKQYKKRR